MAISCGIFPVELRPSSLPLARSTKLTVSSPLLPISRTDPVAAIGASSAQAMVGADMRNAAAIRRSMTILMPLNYPRQRLARIIFDERMITGNRRPFKAFLLHWSLGIVQSIPSSGVIPMNTRSFALAWGIVFLIIVASGFIPGMLQPPAPGDPDLAVD